MGEITVLGDINIDVISSPFKNYPKKDQQTIVSDLAIQLGGSSAIFASACSVLGMKTKFIGRLGSDLFSNFLLDEMRKTGVEVEVEQVKEDSAGITFSLIFKDMKRAMITFRGSNANLSTKDFNFNQIEGKLLHIGGFNLLDNLRKEVHNIFDFARRKGMKTSLDPNWDPFGWPERRLKVLRKTIEKTDFFFPDYEEGKAITGLEEHRRIVKRLLDLCPGIVGLKCGEKGCYVGYGKKIFRAKGFKVRSIQTTGAGDVFDAAFIKSFFLGYDLKYCARFANAAGAISTTRFGFERFPRKEEIEKFLEFT